MLSKTQPVNAQGSEITLFVLVNRIAILAKNLETWESQLATKEDLKRGELLLGRREATKEELHLLEIIPKIKLIISEIKFKVQNAKTSIWMLQVNKPKDSELLNNYKITDPFISPELNSLLDPNFDPLTIPDNIEDIINKTISQNVKNVISKIKLQTSALKTPSQQDHIDQKHSAVRSDVNDHKVKNTQTKPFFYRGTFTVLYKKIMFELDELHKQLFQKFITNINLQKHHEIAYIDWQNMLKDSNNKKFLSEVSKLKSFADATTFAYFQAWNDVGKYIKCMQSNNPPPHMHTHEVIRFAKAHFLFLNDQALDMKKIVLNNDTHDFRYSSIEKLEQISKACRTVTGSKPFKSFWNSFWDKLLHFFSKIRPTVDNVTTVKRESLGVAPKDDYTITIHEYTAESPKNTHHIKNLLTLGVPSDNYSSPTVEVVNDEKVHSYEEDSKSLDLVVEELRRSSPLPETLGDIFIKNLPAKDKKFNHEIKRILKK